MANQFQLNGAQFGKPVHHAPIYTARFYNGLWTNRNPLRDAGSSHLEEKFYGARGDGLIDGLNCEVSTRLTLIRRPGLTIYNTETFLAVNSFYSFRLFNSNTEQIKVMVDTARVLYDGTGLTTKNPIFTKSDGAGQAYMQSVGNTLYFGDGVEQKQWIQSVLSWTANTFFDQGQFVIDPNGNIQESLGSQTGNISATLVTGGSPSGTMYVFFSSSTPLDVPVGTPLQFSGLTTATFLNGSSHAISSSPNSFEIGFPLVHASVGYATDTGTATTGTGVTGTTQPAWNTVVGGITTDGGVLWENRGSQVQNWGIVAPINPPTVTQAIAPTAFPSWVANTWYYPQFAVIDTNSNIQRLTLAGTTGSSQPTWNPTFNGTTTDGSAIWTNKGNENRIASTAYQAGSLIVVTFTYFSGGPVTVTNFFEADNSGTTSANSTASISWNPGITSLTTDGTVNWRNWGPTITWTTFGASQQINPAGVITDTNGNLQYVRTGGESGATSPTWGTSDGKPTTDNTITWIFDGTYTPANTGAWIYAYSFENTLTGGISTASPESVPIIQLQGNQIVLQGQGSSDPQVDRIVIWRTVQDGSVLLFDGTVPNPGGSANWTFYDTLSDTELDNLITAPIDESNNPAPLGLGYLTYHLSRIWGAVNNTVYYSGGPDTIVGNGNETFSPSNSFVFPSKVLRLFPTSIGLLVFTNSNVYVISGTGTSSSPFTPLPFLSENIGLKSYNAFAVNGTTAYWFTSDSQVVSLDVSSGITEVSFPIGDLISSPVWRTNNIYVTWLNDGSKDKSLFVSDGFTGWYRMSPTPSPEVGLSWSPFAALTGGCSAVQSIEITPGVFKLLVGPQAEGPILQRDWSVRTDFLTSYHAYVVVGSIIPAQPGQLAEFKFITLDSLKTGTAPVLSAQLDEIAPLSSGFFDSLGTSVLDPPQLTASNSMYNQRFWFSNTQEPALGRSIQFCVDWGNDTAQNELLAATIFGGYSQES